MYYFILLSSCDIRLITKLHFNDPLSQTLVFFNNKTQMTIKEYLGGGGCDETYRTDLFDKK